jgi:hypothetical protein
MKKWIVGILGVAIVATSVFAAMRMEIIPINNGQGSIVNGQTIKLTAQPLTESIATFYTTRINTAHIKTLNGYFRLDAITFADTAVTILRDTFWVTLATTNLFGDINSRHFCCGG